MQAVYLQGIFQGILILDKQTTQPLHVPYEQKCKMEVAAGVDILPVLSAVFKSLPDSTRKNLLAKVGISALDFVRFKKLMEINVERFVTSSENQCFHC